MLKFSVLCWHFSAPGKNSTTGTVTRDHKNLWESSSVEQVLKIKQPTGSVDWKATGRGVRFAYVRTATKCCEKHSASRFGAAGSALALTEERQQPLQCGTVVSAVWWYGPQLATAHLMTILDYSTQIPGFGLKDRRPNAHFQQHTYQESTT